MHAPRGQDGVCVACECGEIACGGAGKRGSMEMQAWARERLCTIERIMRRLVVKAQVVAQLCEIRRVAPWHFAGRMTEMKRGPEQAAS